MSNFKPDGRRTVIPRIITDDVAGLVRFLKTVFGAGGEPQSATPTELTIGNSVVMILVATLIAACMTAGFWPSPEDVR